jgi:hypothetical protein
MEIQMRVFLSLIATMALLNAGAAQATPHLIIEQVGTHTASLPGNAALPNWGRTPLAVYQAFPDVQLEACRNNPDYAAAWTWMPPIQQARFSTEIIAHDPHMIWVPQLMECMGEKLDLNTEVALVADFGPAFMARYVVGAMPTAVRTQYEAYVAFLGSYLTPVDQSYWWVLRGGVLPDQPGTAAHPLPSNGLMGDLYAYDVMLNSWFTTPGWTSADNPNATGISQGVRAVNFAIRYLKTQVSTGAIKPSSAIPFDGMDDVILVGVLFGIAQAIFAIADSPSAEALNDWMNGLLTGTGADSEVPFASLPFPEISPPDWSDPWYGDWDEKVACVGDAEKCK